MSEKIETGGNKYSPSEFKIVKATMDSVEEYKDFIVKHFCPREPLMLGLHVPLNMIGEHFSEKIPHWLKFGTSVVAIHTPTNRLAGVSFTEILTRDNQSTFNVDTVKKYGKEFVNVMRILTRLEEAVDLFQDPKIDKILEIAVITADSEFSGNKITYRMIEEIERLGKELGCQIATSQFTNKITQHIGSKMGYEVIYKIDYSDLEIDGEKVMDMSALEGSVCAAVFKKYL